MSLRTATLGLAACISPSYSYAEPNPEHFISVPTKLRTEEHRAFFFPDSLVDSVSLARCQTVRQLHYTITLSIANILASVLAMSRTGLSSELERSAIGVQRSHPRGFEDVDTNTSQKQSFKVGMHRGTNPQPAGIATTPRTSPFSTARDGEFRFSACEPPRKRMRYTTPEPQFLPIPAPWKTGPQPSPAAAVLAVSELLAPDNFGIIKVNQIYRCAYPTEEHFEFVQGLKLRTIITLVDEPVPEAYKQLMQHNGIRHIISPVTPNKNKLDRRARTEAKQIWNVLDHMMDERNFPILIHCNAGKHRSGCVSASYRKCTGVKMEDIVGEYHGYAGAKARDLDLHFIRAFDESEYLWSKTFKGQVTGPAPLELEPFVVVDTSSFSPERMRIAKARV